MGSSPYRGWRRLGGKGLVKGGKGGKGGKGKGEEKGEKGKGKGCGAGGPCFAFQKGNCTRGELCIFAH
jgi:hypothetical protein